MKCSLNKPPDLHPVLRRPRQGGGRDHGADPPAAPRPRADAGARLPLQAHGHGLGPRAEAARHRHQGGRHQGAGQTGRGHYLHTRVQEVSSECGVTSSAGG